MHNGTSDNTLRMFHNTPHLCYGTT